MEEILINGNSPKNFGEFDSDLFRSVLLVMIADNLAK